MWMFFPKQSWENSKPSKLCQGCLVLMVMSYLSQSCLSTYCIILVRPPNTKFDTLTIITICVHQRLDRSGMYSTYMGEISQGVQSMNLVSYFLYFRPPFLATYRFAMPKFAIFSENIWVPHGLHVSVWTISTFYIALFSEKCNRT